VHFPFLKKHETIYADKYCQEIDIIMENINCLDMLDNHSMLLLYNNIKSLQNKQ